jgi:hypothetical protein
LGSVRPPTLRSGADANRAQDRWRRLPYRYLRAAHSALRRLVTPLDVRRSTLKEPEHGLLRELVEQAAQHDGPIIEVGTLIGATTTRMALWKSARQRIITVDSYRRNPWGLSPELHYSLTAQVLFFLVETGQIESGANGEGAILSNL